MGKVRLREQTPVVAENGAAPAAGIPLKSLRISGLVIRKADLIQALRAYVPGVSDLQVTEDGEHFWLPLGEGGQGEDPAAG